MGRIVPDAWLPAAGSQRIIVHWTAGSYGASAIDREHYHMMVEGDGHLVQGDHSIADNAHTDDDDYAAHTRGLNTGSIGVACCAMLGAVEHPFQSGSAPLKSEQYEALVQVCADLVEQYHLPVTEKTVLSHGEVQRVYGIAQRGKWDINVLPWLPDLSPAEVGSALRARVTHALKDEVKGHAGTPVNVELDGTVIIHDALRQVAHAQVLVPLRPIAEALGWSLTNIGKGYIRVYRPQPLRLFNIPFVLRGDRGYVYADDLALQCGWSAPVWIALTRTLTLESHS